jgi:hypothetical protein
MVKLSITTKLDGIHSWSLQAGATCPGSFTKGGELVPACDGCYAKNGNYRFPAVKNNRAFNREDWKRADWVANMVEMLDSHRYFRWFDSGDMYSLELAEKILAVMRQTPWCRHWLPTRMAKFEKFATVIRNMRDLSNVSVRFSSDSVTGEFTPGVHGSTIIPDASQAPDGVTVCHAYDRGGKCDGCRACWNRDIPVIGYVAHGVKMKKVIRLIAA